VSRPKPAPDPNRHSPCVRCGQAYQVGAVWLEGRVCVYCYKAAMHTQGSCAQCSHVGVLPGLDDQRRPTCRGCSGVHVDVDCIRCGAEDELYRAHTCWRCALSDQIDVVLAGPDGSVPSALVALADALRSMTRPNSGMTWIRAPRVHAVLRDLATGTVPLDHGALDALPPSRTVEYVRGLLVAHGALPHRDRHLATYEAWLAAKLAKVTVDQERQILERFGRWHHARALRQHAATGPVPRGAFLRAKQSTTVTAGFLAWLTEHDRILSEVTQDDIDNWYAGGTTTRALIETFLYWAMNQRLMLRVTIPRRSTAKNTAFGDKQRIAALRRILLDDQIATSTRVHRRPRPDLRTAPQPGRGPPRRPGPHRRQHRLDPPGP
jgi:hypothetical protein